MKRNGIKIIVVSPLYCFLHPPTDEKPLSILIKLVYKISQPLHACETVRTHSHITLSEAQKLKYTACIHEHKNKYAISKKNAKTVAKNFKHISTL